jgi:hypothetical protein
MAHRQMLGGQSEMMIFDFIGFISCFVAGDD